ncbi:MAG: LysE family transporter [Thermoplasmataceae archaeon]
MYFSMHHMSMSPLLLAVIGLLLGLSLAAPPGPVTAVMVDRSVRSSTGGILVGLGAMTADFILMIATFTVKQFLLLDSLIPFVYLSGAAFFAILAYMVAFHGSGDPQPNSHGYTTGLFMGLSNPFQIGWWLTAGLAFNQKFGILPFYFLFLGIIVWISFLSVAVHFSVVKYGERAREILRGFSSITLAFFAVLFAAYFYLSIMP